MAKKGKKKPQKGVKEAGSGEVDEQFQLGDLVAARVKGWPMWPARLEKIVPSGRQVKYLVRFFATDDVSPMLPATALQSFKTWTPKKHDLNKKKYAEAFKLCQEEHDSRLAAKVGQNDCSPAPSLETAPSEAQSTQSGAQSALSEPSILPKTSASPEPPVPPIQPSDGGSSSPLAPISSCQAESSIKLEDNPIGDKKKSPVKVKLEKVSSSKAKRKVVRKSPTKLDTRTDDNCTILPKTERDDPNFRDLTIKKLQSKIDAKLKEKARMKQEETEKRILKSTSTLMRINRKLAKFLKASQLLNRMILEGSSCSNEWEAAVKEFESIHEALVKCIVFLTKKRRSDDLKTCRDILTDLVKIFRSAKGNNKLPRSTHDKIKSCLKLTRKNNHIKDLINMHDDQFVKQENAMIERKENSADH